LTWVGRKTGRLAKRHRINYRFLFMKSNGEELHQIGELLGRGAIKPHVGRIYDFAEVQQALSYLESGRAKGKIVVRVNPRLTQRN
jgi:alcohol dehydrogenase